MLLPKKIQFKKLDDRGDFMWIKTEELNLDNDYQRHDPTKNVIRKEKINKIAENFLWIECGVLSVVLREDNRYYIIDGGHRYKAALLRNDIDKLPCMVHICYDNVKKEAKTWLAIAESHTSASAFERFNAQISYGDPVAIEMKKFLNSCGYEIVNKKVKDREKGLTPIKLFYDMMKTDKEKAMDTFLALRAMDDGQSIRNQQLKGLFYLAKNVKGEIDIFTSVYILRLKKAGLSVINKEINDMKTLTGKGSPVICALGFLNIMNKGVQEKNKLKLKGRSFLN